MRAKGQTSIHLLLASIVTIFGVMLILITISMAWEPWMVPVIVMGNFLVWVLHIGRFCSEASYENLCASLLMIGFFFFGVHDTVLYDIPAVACMLLLIFSMFDKKRLLHMTIGLYILELFYHFFVLHTMAGLGHARNIIRLGFGATVVAGSMAIATYRINKRREDQKIQEKKNCCRCSAAVAGIVVRNRFGCACICRRRNEHVVCGIRVKPAFRQNYNRIHRRIARAAAKR